MLAGQYPGEPGDDAGTVFDPEAQIICALLEFYRNGFVFAQPFVGKWRYALRAPAADFARNPHQIADYRHSRGMPGAPTVIEGIFAEHALHPHSIVRTLYSSQNRRRRN